ncbi:MAG: DUF1816 domain-containing protein [Calothrix sp. MO_192.B10]|nr:DUF1816 domain-containing protein [Calothrix sp. MO_192.B10]
MSMLWNNIKESLTSTFQNFGLAWWVEIATQDPRCTYYFGPFLNATEAQTASQGYVEDLEMEGAQGIVVNVKKCKPEHLTIAEDLGELIDRKVQPAFSGQIS